MKNFIKQMLSGRAGDISSKRVIAFGAFIVAVVGFFCHYSGFEQFLYFCSLLVGGSLFERK